MSEPGQRLSDGNSFMGNVPGHDIEERDFPVRPEIVDVRLGIITVKVFKFLGSRVKVSSLVEPDGSLVLDWTRYDPIQFDKQTVMIRGTERWRSKTRLQEGGVKQINMVDQR